MRRLAYLVILACLWATPARAGLVTGTYTELTAGTVIDLTAEGTLDWVKFGNGEDNTTTFLTATKIGNPVFVPPILSPLGDADPGAVELIAFSGGQTLQFTWTNGNFGMAGGGPVDTVVTQTVLPAVNEYPIGIGASFTAEAAAETRVLDVYVQGFNADMLITASMSGGGSASTVVTPTQNPSSDPNNDYALGFYRVTYSGAGETLTISVLTQDPRTDGAQAAFANAGIFAAAVRQASVTPVPEPSTATLLAFPALVALGRWARRAWVGAAGRRG